MSESYRDMIERELPEILDSFGAVRPEHYELLSHHCLESFCNGMYIGLQTRKRGLPLGKIIAVPRYIAELTPPEITILNNAVEALVNMGAATYWIHRSLRHADLIFVPEAADFLAEKLGCKDYCGKALSQFLGIDDNKKPD